MHTPIWSHPLVEGVGREVMASKEYEMEWVRCKNDGEAVPGSGLEPVEQPGSVGGDKPPVFVAIRSVSSARVPRSRPSG